MKKFQLTAIVGLATFVLGGCAGMTSSNDRTAASALESKKAELARREAALARDAAALNTKKMRFEEAQKKHGYTSAMAPRINGENDAGGLLPPNPRPGECYARVIIPANFDTMSEQVMLREASERIQIIPARYETLAETVLIKEAATRLEVIPATYENVEERVMVKPASSKLEVVPAVYETISERIMVRPASQKTIEVPGEYDTVTERVQDQPARTEWKRGTGRGSGSGVALASAAHTIERFGDLKVLKTRFKDTGEVMCLVEIPATFKTIEKQVLVKPASTRVNEVPAEYKTIKKTVLKKPATTREITIPAQYRTVKVTKQVQPETTREVTIPAEYGKVKVNKLVQPASERRIPIPAEYTTVTRRNMVSAESTEWRPVLCEVNMTRENVSALQTSLNKTGCCRCGPNRNECMIDGIMGPCTLKAAQCYADRKGISSGEKYVTIDTIRELGLAF